MGIIDVKNFEKSFKGRNIHKDVTFTVNKGECLGLVGGSGSGKSVLLKSLIGLIKPDAGEILIDGELINSFDDDDLRRLRQKVAYVFQNGALFDSMDIYENLAYPLRAHTDFSEDKIKEKIERILELLGLESICHILPSQLSGGMQKRVGLARSIILEPDVILYDEPTAGLDPFNTKNIQDIILRLKATGVTSIFVSHDVPSALIVCDRLALLSEGQIVLCESVDNINNNPNSHIHKFLNGEEI
ncbi:MAG: ATP-binding cassette domain-containing protein [Bdellovibrionaceae bacterium]|nr:ATP-binding cassette domain-containing protein [Pseudobdellovibrionaceae bacterium]